MAKHFITSLAVYVSVQVRVSYSGYAWNVKNFHSIIISEGEFIIAILAFLT